jgi:hypothetical protein
VSEAESSGPLATPVVQPGSRWLTVPTALGESVLGGCAGLLAAQPATAAPSSTRTADTRAAPALGCMSLHGSELSRA